MVAKVPAAGVDLDGAITINESSGSVDFRVESNGETHALFVDASADAVCINTDTHDTGPLVVQTGNTHATAMTVQSTGHTQIMLKDTDASSNDKYWGLQVSGGDFNILTCDDDKASNFLTPITIDSTGAVTKPLQPAFLVTKSGAQSNVTNNTTITWDSEIYDQNADFASNTFTAPVTGRYLFSYQIRIYALASNMTYALFNTQTANRTYQNIYNTQTGADVSTIFRNFTGSIVADMDANDTAIISYGESGGSVGTADVDGSFSYWSGTLLC